ncbi:MAG: hypothetical protein Q7J05_04500 [Paludibacter sp.]|nr:hypothetical protein [Paludibacter sp.]
MVYCVLKKIICFSFCYIAIGCANNVELVPEGANPPKYEKDYVIPVEYKKDLSSNWRTDANSLNTLLVENIGRYPVRNTQLVNEWGSRLDDLSFTNIIGKEGFFRIGKNNDRWYFIDPTGKGNIIRGTQDVRPFDDGYYTSSFPGGDAEWSKTTGEYLVENGFNCTLYGGLYPVSMPAVIAENILRPNNGANKVAYMEILFILRSFMWQSQTNSSFRYDDSKHNRLYLIYEDEYLNFIDNWAKTKCALYVNDSHFIGYMLDNELNHKAYNNQSPQRGINILSILENKDGSLTGSRIRGKAIEFWETQLNSKSLISFTDSDIEAFSAVVADDYFRTVTEAVRRYDSNHLILGSRLYDMNKYNKVVLKACARYCDVISINYYNTWSVESFYIDNIREWTDDAPFIVTEFYTKGADAKLNGASIANNNGGGWIVRGQKERGYYYQNMCIGLLKAKNCIGWLHFNYRDINLNGDITNKGIISIDYKPYEEFVETVKVMHINTYPLIDFFDR